MKKLEDEEWKKARRQILLRDDFTCHYCEFRSEKYQIVHHIDRNPENNANENLTTICQDCNLIDHSGQGCVVQGVVDLYAKSNYSQVEIIRITRDMRDKGKSDAEIIKFLGLKIQAPFLMERAYLMELFGFVTSRPTIKGNEMFDSWRKYHQTQLRNSK